MFRGDIGKIVYYLGIKEYIIFPIHICTYFLSKFLVAYDILNYYAIRIYEINPLSINILQPMSSLARYTVTSL